MKGGRIVDMTSLYTQSIVQYRFAEDTRFIGKFRSGGNDFA